VKFNPLRVTPAHAVKRHKLDELRINTALQNKSSSNRPTSFSANAVHTAVLNPKHLRSPRATLYSPPPSHTLNSRAVRMRPFAGIEAQHDLAQCEHVVFAGTSRFNIAELA
jgi:hypothetical protein